MQDSLFPQGSLSPSEMSFIVLITIYQSCLKDVEAFTPKRPKVKRLRSVLIRSPCEICACSVRKEVPCALSAEHSGLMRGKREENLYTSRMGGGGLRGHYRPAETFVFFFFFFFYLASLLLKNDNNTSIINLKKKKKNQFGFKKR